MSWHPSCYGMYSILDFDPFLFQKIGNLFKCMLCLGYSQSVPRRYNHFLSVRALNRYIVGKCLLIALICISIIGRCASTSECTEENIIERPIHRPTHNIRQEQVCCTDKTTTSEQKWISENKPCHRRAKR